MANYTKEEVIILKDLYAGGTSLEDISEIIDKSVNSIRAKLVSLELYIKDDTKQTKVVNKKQLVEDIEKKTKLTLPSLVKISKPDLCKLWEWVFFS